MLAAITDLSEWIHLKVRLVLCCRVAAVKRLPVHQYSADYIFWSFGIIELISGHLKIEFRISWR